MLAKATKHERPVMVRENEDLVELRPNSHQLDHDRQSRVKSGAMRLDKRSARGVSGLPKKMGQGGKFTWDGPTHGDVEAREEGSPPAMDENDPNYVDEEEEVFDRYATELDQEIDVSKPGEVVIDGQATSASVENASEPR